MITKYHLPAFFLCMLIIFSACQKEFSIDDGIVNPPVNSGSAVFTFSGTPGNCSNPVIKGIFQEGTPVDSSNKIAVQVDVTSIGTYTISTGSVNGITFSSTGTFTSKGLQNIIFSSSGTPIASGSFNFTFGTGGCTFSLTCVAGTPNNDNCKECIYVPFCVGSKYVYSDTTLNPLTGDVLITERISNYLSATDTVIASKAYKKVQISDGTNASAGYVNCFNGETTTISYNVQSSTSGNVLVAIKSTELKANAAVGTTWTDTSAFASGNTLYRKHIITEKGITRKVYGANYSDVIKVTVNQSILYVDPPYGLVQSGITEYYFAKGIGLIETLTYAENPLTNETYVAYHSVLKSYLIP